MAGTATKMPATAQKKVRARIRHLRERRSEIGVAYRFARRFGKQITRHGLASAGSLERRPSSERRAATCFDTIEEQTGSNDMNRHTIFAGILALASVLPLRAEQPRPT